MSCRPTNSGRVTLARTVTTSSTSAAGTLIIGDTAANALYARRLVANGVVSPINMVTEARDYTTDPELPSQRFAVDHTKTILKYLIREQVQLLHSSDETGLNNRTGNPRPELAIDYYVGAGILGDFVSAYIIPRAGPWFYQSSNAHLVRFFNDSTIQRNLNAQERVINTFLKTTWGIRGTNSLVVEGPCILDTHYEFLTYADTRTEDDDFISRQLFLQQYNTAIVAPNVNISTEVYDMKFTRNSTTTPDTWNFTSSKLSLTNVRVKWETNPFTYIRLATNGGINPRPILLPTFYRARIAIPLKNDPVTMTVESSSSSSSMSGGCGCGGSSSITSTVIAGVDLTNITPGPDMVTTYQAFSLYDFNNTGNSAVCWLGQCYTTTEDLSDVNPGGLFSSPGYTFLIVEALCLKNKRTLSYSTTQQAAQFFYNSSAIEDGYLDQFGNIVADIYQAYTGLTTTNTTLIGVNEICDSKGQCSDISAITDYVTRESPMSTVIQLATVLYGYNVFGGVF
jgi:hypothetical protein